MKIAKPLATVVLAGAIGAVCFLPGQTSASTLDGVYTVDQAQRGRAIYGQQCYECHSRDLSGAYESHALAGDEFTSDWEGQPVSALFERIRLTMSGNASGKISGPPPPPLTREQTADLVAFLLWFNEMPPGKTELSPKLENLRQIRFVTPKP